MTARRMRTPLSTNSTRRCNCWPASQAWGATGRSWLQGFKVFPLAGTSFSTEWLPARLKLSAYCTAPGTSRIHLRAKEAVPIEKSHTFREARKMGHPKLKPAPPGCHPRTSAGLTQWGSSWRRERACGRGGIRKNCGNLWKKSKVAPFARREKMDP
jgi:hypothetical protein